MSELIEYKYLNMNTEQFAKNQILLFEQLRGCDASIKSVCVGPVTLVAAGSGEFSEKDAVELCEKLTKEVL